MKPGKRSSQDKEWKSLVTYIRQRDKFCRLMKVLTVGEMSLLKKNAPKPLLNTFDPAHVIAASKRGDMVYDPSNIVLLNRYSHEQLDYNRCPLTGRRLTQNQVHQWWARIVGPQNYKELLNKATRTPQDPSVGQESDSYTEE